MAETSARLAAATPGAATAERQEPVAGRRDPDARAGSAARRLALEPAQPVDAPAERRAAPRGEPAAESPAERLLRFQRPGTLALAASPPLSLYVHLPWCLRKCPYCDFNSHEHPAPPESAYLDALRLDLEASLPLVWGRRVHTVFFGGGTPSLFSPDAIGRLIADIRARLPLEPGCEITLEANPGTFERERFRAFRDAGVTRLSLGVQSFDDEALAALGRAHDGAQARAAAEEARAVFDTFNLDLMYALPGQTVARLEADLAQALAFAPPHVSVYHLTIEANTVYAKRPPPGLPDDDTAFAMLDAIVDRTRKAGLERYEVSAFAQPGHRAAHNLNYWRFGDYLGIGAGAHSKLSYAHRVIRQARARDPLRYIERAGAGRAIVEEREVARADLPFEFMLGALRLVEGFELSRYAERTGLPLGSVDAALAAAEARGLVVRDLHRVWPTTRGLDFLSDLQALFLP